MFVRKKLDNGIRVVYEHIPYMRSVAFGLWISSGSRNERSANNGISHFIEHMLFKGTKTRTAKEIAAVIDNIGGQLNGFTGKECTCIYTRTLDEHLEIAVELLADMIFNSRFSKKDIAVEKSVVCEEINMHEDDPEDLVHDMLYSAVWKTNSLGYPILGTKEGLDALDKKDIKEYFSSHFNPCNLVIAVAGSFDESMILDVIHKHFGGWTVEDAKSTIFDVPDFKNGIMIREKDTEQVNICIGFESIEHGNDDIYPLLIANNILGGGMSSRLFQKIREQKGLVYSVYTFPSSYKNAGLFTVYAGMKPDNLAKVIKIIIDEIEDFKDKGIDLEDLGKSKEQLKGNFILGLEGTGNRMNSIGKSELLLGYILTPEEVLSKIDAVNPDDMSRVIEKVFDFDKAGFAAIGRIGCDFEPFS